MKKRILSIITCLALCLSMLPTAALAASDTAQVGTWDEFKAALANSNVTTIVLSGTISSDKPSGDDPLCITRGVTITGGELSLSHAGIVLGADVTFENISITFLNSVRNAIIANGYALTLNEVTKSSSSAWSTHIFCGGISDYTGNTVLPNAGSSGRILVQGSNNLGNIFAGSLSDLGVGVDDVANSFGGTVSITIDSGATGFGKIYAHGARENRSGYLNSNGTDTNVSGDQLLPSADKYKATGGVTINLSNTTSTVYGATGGGTNATVNFNASSGNQALHTLKNIGALNLNNDEAHLAPAAGSTIDAGAAVTLPANSKLDLSNLGNITIGSLNGGGTLTLGGGQTLTIGGAVSGTTSVSVSAAGECITAAKSTDTSFVSQNDLMELTRGSDGVWTAEWLTIPVTDLTLTAATVSTDDTRVSLPVSVTFADEDAIWDDFIMLDTVIKVDENEAVYDDENLVYVDTNTGLALYFSIDTENLIVEPSSGGTFTAGTYTISVTVPAGYTTNGEAITGTATLTVTDDSGNSGGTASYPVWVGGVQVTDANAANVLGDGTVTFTPAGDTVDDPDTSVLENAPTLTLNGATITAAATPVDVDYNYNPLRGIYSRPALNLVLTGANTITANTEADSAGVMADSMDLTISGGGSLKIAGCGHGISAGKLMIDGVTIEIIGSVYAISLNAGGTITDSTVSAVGSAKGISTANGTIEIDNSSVYVKGETHSFDGTISGVSVLLSGGAHVKAEGAIDTDIGVTSDGIGYLRGASDGMFVHKDAGSLEYSGAYFEYVGAEHLGDATSVDGSTHSYPCTCDMQTTVTEAHSLAYSASGSKITEGCDACSHSATAAINAPTGPLTWNGQTREATVEYSEDWAGGQETITYTGADYAESPEAPWEPGTYTASITIGGATASVNFTIEKMEGGVTTLPAAIENLTYTGKAQALVTAGKALGEEQGCTMQYSLDKNGAYSTEIPTATDAGTYTVWYKAVGGDYHNDSTPASVTATISPKDITGATVDSFTAMTYNGAAQTPQATVTIGGLTATGTWSQVTNVGETTTFIADGNFTGTLTDQNPNMQRRSVTITAGSKTILTTDEVPAIAGWSCSVTSSSLVSGHTVTASYKYDTQPQKGTEGEHTVSFDGDVKIMNGSTDVTANYDITTATGTLTITTHRHNWSYTSSGATITATCSAENCPANGTATITLAAPMNRTYSGDPINAVVTVSPDGELNAPTVTYTGTGVENGSPVNAGQITATITLGSASASVSYSIAKAPLTTNGNVTASGTYGTKLSGLTVAGPTVTSNGRTVTGTWALNGDTIPNVGDTGSYTATFAPDDGAGNYDATLTAPVTLTITPATTTPVAGQLTVTNSYAASYTYDLGQLLPDLASGLTYGSVAYTLGNITLGSYYTSGASISGSTLTLPIESIASTTEGSIGAVSITITSGNYTFTAATINVGSSNKRVPQGTPTLSPASITYGQALSTVKLSGTMKAADGTVVAGDFTWDAPDTQYGAGVYGAAWIFTPKDTETYMTVTGTVEITVNKATPTGAPKYTAITTSGKTLADAGLTTTGSTFNVPGTVAWELADTTTVTANTAYKWIFTPSDTANYNELTGTVTLYSVYSGGGSSGGGGNSTPSTPSTPTVSTSDKTEGGTTTTETTATPNATTKGDTATSTITNSVGNQIVEQAKENGSAEVVIAPTITGNVSKTEVSIPASTVGDIGSETAANLTVSTPVADVSIPNGGLSDLASAGGTVTVTAEKVGNRVTLEVTAGGEAVSEVTGGITLTVPHDDCDPGTVAVLVHENGTREVVRKSVADNGTLTVTIPLTGSATLELVDNAIDFEDVAADAWYSDAVDFVSARGLFGGVSDTAAIFDGDRSMTRGMLAVVLHRLENEPDHAFTGSFDDVPEGSWYGEAIHWMAEAGIAGGYGNGDFGAEDDITREQLAVMLWRYAGSPVPKGTALNFTDAGEASSWAVDALIWAEENGIMQGYNNAVNPKGTATRAHVAQMLKNFMENILK